MENKLKEIYKNGRPYYIYTLIFLLIIFIMGWQIIFEKRSMVYNVDGRNQYYPVFLYCFRWLKNLINNGTLQEFDFAIGMGSDVIGTLNYYGFGDPITMFLALFPEKFAPQLYAFMFIIKLYLAGIFIIKFSKYYLSDWILCVSVGILYTFMSYTLRFGSDLSGFLNPIMTFPLMLIGVKEIILTKKKCSVYLILGLFYQAMNGFYFLYMECIAIGIFFLFSILKLENKLQKIVVFGLNIIVGIGTVGMIFIPAIYALFGSSRGGTWTPTLLYEKSTYIGYLSNLFVPWPKVECIYIAPILVIGFFLCKKSFTVWTGIVGLIFPVFAWIMSGFSYPSNRWYFIYFVILVIEVAKRYNIGERINKKECVICTGVLIASVIILIANNETTFFLIIRTIVYCIFTVTAILTLYKGNATIFMTWCICFSIVNGLIFMLPTDKGGSGASDWFISMENLLNYEFTSIAEQDVDETNYFERKDIYSDNISAGISLVTDENRTTSYFSLINKCMYEFWCELEISPAIWANWNLKGLDTRSELQALLSCSQYTQYYEDEEGIVRENINDSEWYLPLGFTYDTYITREEFEVLNTTDKAKVMLENIVLEEENILLDKGEESSDSQKLNITVETENAIWDNKKELITTDAGGKLRIYIKDIEMVNKFLAGEGELYVDLNDFYRTQGDKNTLYVGNKRLQICKIDNTQYYTGLTDYLVNVTELKRDEQGYYIDIKFSSEIQEWHLDSIECWFHSLKEISSLVDKRSNNTLSDLSIVSDRICGTINTNDKEILFMSIPYSSGWTAYVDGNEVEILKSNVGFISIIPGEGIHEIEFIYHAPGIIIGGMISGISFLLGMILLFFDYKKYRSNLKKEL